VSSGDISIILFFDLRADHQWLSSKELLDVSLNRSLMCVLCRHDYHTVPPCSPSPAVNSVLGNKIPINNWSSVRSHFLIHGNTCRINRSFPKLK